MIRVFTSFLLFLPFIIDAQNKYEKLATLDLSKFEKDSKHLLWLSLSENALGQAIEVPVIVIKGKSDRPIMGITAAIHGNEVNGTAIVHNLVDQVDPSKLHGVILAFPILNPQGYQLSQREDLTGEDLNRIFPGKKNGTESEQFVWAIKEKILPHFDFLIDIHTASFGRANSMYVRANLKNDTLAQMAKLLHPDIILDSKSASAGIITSASKTMRQEAEESGVYGITLEAGDPQIVQNEMTKRGTQGILNILTYLNMLQSSEVKINAAEAKYCTKSYWIYTDKGGFLDVPVSVNQRIKKGEIIATLKDVFGQEVTKYISPEDGVVIGKSTHPVAAAGARIIQLGIER